jgi:hypothetical protein
MTLRNMRELGVQRADRVLPQRCLPSHGADRRVSYPAETEVPSFGRRAVCGKCGGKRVDVGPNWKDQQPSEGLTGKPWQ